MSAMEAIINWGLNGNMTVEEIINAVCKAYNTDTPEFREVVARDISMIKFHREQED